ncbi:hypothetical protein B296_00028958, partial [Ensete ventricosum]
GVGCSCTAKVCWQLRWYWDIWCWFKCHICPKRVEQRNHAREGNMILLCFYYHWNSFDWRTWHWKDFARKVYLNYLTLSSGTRQKFVGVGARRVRSLFQAAKKKVGLRMTSRF